MKHSRICLLVFVVLIQFAAFSQTAAQGRKTLGPPDHFWHGPWPDPDEGGCPADYHPVQDARGNFYSSPCEAALQHVRATWDVTPD